MSSNVREQINKQVTDSEQVFSPNDLKGKGELQSDNPYELLVHGAEFEEEDEEDTDYISGDIAEEKAEDVRDQVIPSDDEDEEFDLEQQKMDEGGDEFEEPQEEEEEVDVEEEEEVELEEEEDTFELYKDLTKPVSQVCKELANKASSAPPEQVDSELLLQHDHAETSSSSSPVAEQEEPTAATNTSNIPTTTTTTATINNTSSSSTPPSSTVLTPPTDPLIAHTQHHPNFILKEGEEDKGAHVDTASPQLAHKRKIGTDEDHARPSSHPIDQTKKLKLE